MKDFNPFFFFFGTMNVKEIHLLYLRYAAPIVNSVLLIRCWQNSLRSPQATS